MKTLNRSRTFFPLLLSSLLFLCRGNAAVADPTTPTKSPANELVEVGHEKESGPIVFDMGVLDQMDDTQRQTDFADEKKYLPWQKGYQRVLPGLKHTFHLKNTGARDISLNFLETSSICTQVATVKNGKYIDVTAPLKPGDTVDILVAFNFYLSSPGLVREQVNLLEPKSKQPVATLVMQGQVQGGIRFLEKSLDYGKQNLGGQSREFTLVFNKRVPYQMTPSPLKLVCSNPNITIQSLDEGKTIMGVKVDKNQMTFPMDVTFPQELRLRFRATLSEKAPVGPITGRVTLVMVGAPLAIIVKDVTTPIQGEIVGKK